MKKHISAVFCVILIVLTCVQFSNNAVPIRRDQQDNKTEADVIGLYSKTDDVEILTLANFKSQIYGNKRAWIVEFYNSWCGFCQRFAPSWKALATDTKAWKDLIAIGAIDCANDDNNPICREFEIMGYPTLKYFHENYIELPTNLGIRLAAGTDVDEHRHMLIDRIFTEQNEGRGNQFPIMSPYIYDDISHIFDSISTDKKYVFLTIQEPTTYIGQEIALDFHKVEDIAMRLSYANNTILIKTLNAKNFPALYVIGRDNTLQSFTNMAASREGFGNAILQFLKSKNIKFRSQDTAIAKPVVINPLDLSSIMQERERQMLRERIKKMGDVVFQMDLETSLRYSLHEVSRNKVITGEKLEALRKYIDILAKYFPFGKYGQAFLQELRNYVHGDSVKGSEIATLLHEAEKPDRQVFSSPQQWLGCRGSEDHYRGYPCSLWKLFHYLTVNVADHEKDLVGANPKIVLEAMHGYIKNFFGCTDCSKHFQEMAAKREIDKVSSHDGAVLWLWKAHNEVNNRLSGDATEDPEFPKVQFPSKQRCPQCYNQNGTWIESEVLLYLKQIYSSINVRYVGSDTRILHLGLDGSSLGTSGSSSLFKAIDASMCFVLYVSSFLLIVILIRMFLKGGYKKKIYRHDLLGKI